ncbi:MAG TPA: thioesterase family protein [Myxococcaceae bacterium]|nr:thioesterase family protein [Myxococcaceae bacterium]
MFDTLEGYPITVRFTVHWSEMDAYGHVNNARYLVWFESARIDYLSHLGLVGAGHSGLGPILASTHADFLKPVVFPANLLAGARVSRIGRSSITMEHVVVDADRGTVYARGGAVIVTLRYPEYEKTLVPQEVRAAIETLEGRSFAPSA